jgi:epsilon-lactone hydrolase
MTRQQRDTVDQMIRQTWGDSSANPGLIDLGGEIAEQRRLFGAMMTSIPLPADVHTKDTTLGGVPVVTITVGEEALRGTILYFHGGAYALGSAAQSAGVAAQLARRSGARAISVEYALAPENPYPAGLNDAVAAYRALLDDGVPADGIVLAGESSGGGLALATVLEITAAGLPRPAAVYVASPWVDLTLTGTSMTTKADADPSVTAEGLQRRAGEYAGSHDRGTDRISPVFANLAGFPPLLIQVGGNEVLLDDATRLATRAAADGVPVTLEVTPEVPHVFVGLAGVLDEADEALAKAGDFIRTNLAG